MWTSQKPDGLDCMTPAEHGYTYTRCQRPNRAWASGTSPLAHRLLILTSSSLASAGVSNIRLTLANIEQKHALAALVRVTFRLWFAFQFLMPLSFHRIVDSHTHSNAMQPQNYCSVSMHECNVSPGTHRCCGCWP